MEISDTKLPARSRRVQPEAEACPEAEPTTHTHGLATFRTRNCPVFTIPLLELSRPRTEGLLRTAILTQSAWNGRPRGVPRGFTTYWNQAADFPLPIC